MQCSRRVARGIARGMAVCVSMNGIGFAATASKRPFVVADAIAMTTVVQSDEAPDGLIFSPDGTEFLVVTSVGDLATNTNVYRLLAYRNSDPEHPPIGRVLATFASSSNRHAIAEPMGRFFDGLLCR